MKKFLIIVLSILILLIGVCVVIKLTKVEDEVEFKPEDELESGIVDAETAFTKVVDTKEIDGIKDIDSIKMSNIKIDLMANGSCRISADVENTSENFFDGTNVLFSIINESGDNLGTFAGSITSLAGFEKSDFETYTVTNIMAAQDFEIRVDL